MKILVGSALASLALAGLSLGRIAWQARRPETLDPVAFATTPDDSAQPAEPVLQESQGVVNVADLMPKVGQSVFIVEDRDTGALRNKIGIFTGFEHLDAENTTEGFVLVGTDRLSLDKAIWLTLPADYQKYSADIAFCVGCIRAELAHRRLASDGKEWAFSKVN